jgi:hypothetical protein
VRIKLILAAFVLSGCSITQETTDKIAEDTAFAEHYNRLLEESINAGEYSDQALIAGDTFDIEPENELPPILYKITALQLHQNVAGIRVVTQHIARQTGIPIVFGQMTSPVQSDDEEEAGYSLDGALLGDFEGTFIQLLDYATRNTGTTWEYDHRLQRIRVFRYDTRWWPVSALSLSDTIKNEAGRGSTLTSSTESDSFNALEEVANLVSGQVGNDGTFSISRNPPIVSVTHRPHVLDALDSLLDEYNRRATAQVAISFRLYSIKMSSLDNYGFNPDVRWEGNNVAGGFSAASNVLNELTTGGFSIIDSSSPFSGSNVLVNALSEKADVSLVASTSFVALNNTPTTRHVGDSRSLIAELQQTLVADAGATVTATLKEESDGVHVSFIPLILNDEELILDVAVDLTTLLEPDSFQIGDNLLQAFRKSSRDFSQRLKLRSGETLVISGFDSMESARTKQGTGSADAWFLGGGSNASQERTIVVAMITTQVQYPQDPRY